MYATIEWVRSAVHSVFWLMHRVLSIDGGQSHICSKRNRRYRWIHTVVVFLTVVSCALGNAPAIAQTSTPTPTATVFSTPTSTPSPVGSPTLVPGTPTPPVLGSTVMWYCYLKATDNEGNGAGVAPICGWGKDFYFQNQRHKKSGDGFIDNRDTNYDRVVLIPPSSTKQITLVCHTFGQAYSIDRGTGGAGASARVSFAAHPSPYVTAKKNGSVTLSDNLIQVNFTQGNTFDAVDTMVWRLEDAYSSWPAPDIIPDEYGDYVNYVGIAIRSSANATGHTDNEALGITSADCEVTEVQRLDGSTYVPTEPVVGPTVTPGIEPSPTTDWNPIPWVPITNSPNSPTFTVGVPGATTCYVILPEFTWDWDSTGYGWEEIELCSQSYDIGLSAFGVDLGDLLLTAFLLMGAGILISILKAGG